MITPRHAYKNYKESLEGKQRMKLDFNKLDNYQLYELKKAINDMKEAISNNLLCELFEFNPNIILRKIEEVQNTRKLKND